MSGLCLPEVLEKLVQYVLRERPKTKAELFAAMEHHLLSCYDALTRGASDGAGPPADASLRIRGSSGRFSAATAAQIERGRDGLADLQSDRLDILRDWALPPGLGLLDSVRALDLGDLSAYCFCPVCGRSTSDLEPHLWGEHQRLVSEVPEPGRLTVSGIIKLALVFAHEREQEGCALRRDHVLVQHLYTMETPIYRTINRLLREKQAAALQPWLPFLHFLKESLRSRARPTPSDARGVHPMTRPNCIFPPSHPFLNLCAFRGLQSSSSWEVAVVSRVSLPKVLLAFSLRSPSLPPPLHADTEALSPPPPHESGKK